MFKISTETYADVNVHIITVSIRRLFWVRIHF